jgi:hypothetical protein
MSFEQLPQQIPYSAEEVDDTPAPRVQLSPLQWLAFWILGAFMLAWAGAGWFCLWVFRTALCFLDFLVDVVPEIIGGLLTGALEWFLELLEW